MNESQQVRLAGGAFVAISAVLTKITILNVFEAARQHASIVSVSAKTIAMIPLLFICGVFLVVGGKQGIELGNRAGLKRGPDGHMSPRLWAVVIALIGLGVGLEWWVEQRLAALGYP
jgi:hypothetical protein